MAELIRAAGGVPWRHRDGALELAVVHRPRYDDWSFPKGKSEKDEPALRTAVREIGEETGLTVRVGRRLPTQHYQVDGVDKQVDYWAMAVADGPPVDSDDEVDQLAWLSPEDAVRRLSYDRDAVLVTSLLERPVGAVALLLVRHGKAGDSASWAGEDQARPLDEDGRREAADLAVTLPLFAPRRVLVGGPLRCRQTVQPLARGLGLDPEDVPPLSFDGYLADPGRARGLVAGLLTGAAPAVVVSQGGAVSGLVAWLTAAGAEVTGVSPNRTDPTPPERKGSFWAVSVDGAGAVVAADYYPPR